MSSSEHDAWAWACHELLRCLSEAAQAERDFKRGRCGYSAVDMANARVREAQVRINQIAEK